MDPQQLALNNSFADVPLVIDSIDCICGMSVPPIPSSAPISTVTESEEAADASVFTIQCDDCGRWLHGSCVGLTPEDVIPDNFSCPKCIEHRPSPVVTPTPCSGSVGRPRKNRTLSNTDEYVMTNQVAGDASSALKLLMLQYEELLDSLPKDAASSLGSFNYEFSGDCIAVPEEYDIRQLDKAIDVREIRSRGGQPKKGSIKRGLFAAQSVEPGQAICEFCGHVMRIETLFSRINRVTTVQQSFVLFPVTKADVIIDARKHGSPARWIRRSCRPNSTVKSVIQGSDVHWFVFAKHALKPGDELFLPLDWDAGNRFFRYECACNSPDTCLAPDDLLPEGFRENALLHREQMDTISPLESHAPPVSSSTAVFTPSDNRKMSREEKKLQRYIEAIERMENAERKRSRSTPSSSPETKESRRPNSPNPPPKKPLERKPAVPLKKAWAQKIESKIIFSPSPLSSSPITPREEEKQQPQSLLEEENIDVETMDDDARDAVTPVSQIVEEQPQPESATKRLSLSDYLHRRQLSATSESPKITSSPTKEEEHEEQEEHVHDDHSDDFVVDRSDRLSDASNASRESGEYIEAPSVHLQSQSIPNNSPPPSTRYQPSYSNSGYYYSNNSNNYYSNNSQYHHSNSSSRNRPHHHGSSGSGGGAGFRGRPHYRPHNYHYNSRGRPYNHHYGRRRDYPPPPNGNGAGGYR